MVKGVLGTKARRWQRLFFALCLGGSIWAFGALVDLVLFHQRGPFHLPDSRFHELWMHLIVLLAVGVYAVFLYIAGRRQEVAVREEAACDLILDSINEAVCLIDPRTFKIIEANRVFLKEVGLLREEVIGRPCYELTHQKDSPCQPPECPCPVFYTLETGEPAIFEHIHWGAGGEKRYVEVSSFPVKDEKGQVGYIVHISRDLTHRRMAEEEIRQLLDKIQRIMDSVPEGVLLLDDGLRVEVANPLAQDYLALLGEVSSKGELRGLAGVPIEEFLRSEAPRDLEIQEPSFRAFTVATRPLKVGSQLSGWVVVIREITGERQLRDRALAQEKLAAVGQLAAGIAHDFNNLLTSIISFAELLSLDPQISPMARKKLELIISQGQRAAELTRQILDYSRKSVLKTETLDVSSFLKELVVFLKRTIPENIDLRLEIAPGEYLVEADATKLQQALINLALNARDAMPEGGQLTLSLSKVSFASAESLPCDDMVPGDWVAISVSDTGSGIPPEVLPHIFEPFFTTKDRGRGTGLGLPQVEGIVRQHGGCLTVHTVSGQGTTMTIYLQTTGQQRPRAIQSDSLVSGQGETILLVEDEDSVLEALRSSLEALGYRVISARGGAQALEIYTERASEIALVITDMVMPEMSGLELLRRLKDLNSYVRVLLLSGYPLGEDQRFLKDLKDVAWLHKPVGIKELSMAVAKALKG
ncbi:PAS domain-containing hybrid sensor histidine kinase/response regulator [Thermosulfuriphilus sp.]